MPFRMDAKSREVRFWRKVEKRGADECWPWIGARDGARAYGRVYLGRAGQVKGFFAHRIAYEYSVGPIPCGLLICHKCDNPPCCNPSHLFVGTHRDNSSDKIAKGRGTTNRGEKNPMAKLTVRDVEEIRELLASAEMSQNAIAERFRVAQGQISRIHTGKGWV